MRFRYRTLIPLLLLLVITLGACTSATNPDASKSPSQVLLDDLFGALDTRDTVPIQRVADSGDRSFVPGP